jgi:hypothetical protein
MSERSEGALSERLQQLSTDLKEFELDLKSGAAPEATLLHEFREVLDNVRMTAWTASELLNAAQTKKDPEKMLSFLAAERLRRSTQMLKDLCTDIDEQGVTWQTSGVIGLYETVTALQQLLSKVIDQHRGRFEKVKAKQTGC